ncbi:DUF192 domain-containing protein [Candidatus Woesearchaeota archaeon]|nr:MAG: DUF192 domain-containing protein [Candidatus Woesearchaeota archaeon]
MACTQPQSVGQVPAISFENASFTLEVARTAVEKQQGLMFRESLADDAGMLFIFDDTAPRGFWMKNTLIPLDMIYLDENFTVVEVKENVPPCTEDPCPTYVSVPARYVLEVNAGASARSGIRVGSRATLRE